MAMRMENVLQPVPGALHADGGSTVVRIAAEDGASWLTHSNLGRAGDGRMPQLELTQDRAAAKLFEVSSFDQSSQTFGLRCDRGYLTSSYGEVRAGAKKLGKGERFVAVCNMSWDNQKYIDGFVELWSASKPLRPAGSTGSRLDGSERAWRIERAAAAAGGKGAIDVPNKPSTRPAIGQWKLEVVEPDEASAELTSWGSVSNAASAGGNSKKRPLGTSGSNQPSVMEVSQKNQKKMHASGGAVKPTKEKKEKKKKDPNAPKGKRNAYIF